MNDAKADSNITFSLETTSGTPIYRQIIQQIEYAILSERLKPGDRLPTIRALAVDLKINPNTIAKAYGELEIRGVLTTQVGSGTFISNKKPEARESIEDIRHRKIQEVLGRFMQELEDLGLGKNEILSLIRKF
ncbi:MAG: GntR family transcriptional regulator [Treponema sp.]|jgi:GntR family transcriptional regulator|nr:GntR family transcriptional regulator [Treponema sp.]